MRNLREKSEDFIIKTLDKFFDKYGTNPKPLGKLSFRAFGLSVWVLFLYTATTLNYPSTLDWIVDPAAYIIGPLWAISLITGSVYIGLSLSKEKP